MLTTENPISSGGQGVTTPFLPPKRGRGQRGPQVAPRVRDADGNLLKKDGTIDRRKEQAMKNLLNSKTYQVIQETKSKLKEDLGHEAIFEESDDESDEYDSDASEYEIAKKEPKVIEKIIEVEKVIEKPDPAVLCELEEAKKILKTKDSQLAQVKTMHSLLISEHQNLLSKATVLQKVDHLASLRANFQLGKR